MIPEQLKLSILQSAFQGKLTGECVPNETAMIYTSRYNLKSKD